MNATDLTEFHSLVEQFESEMSLKDICAQEGGDYRSYISWRQRKGYSKSRKSKAPATMVEVEVSDIPTALPSTEPGTSAGKADVHIEFENGLVLDLHGMDVERLIEFLDRIKPRRHAFMHSLAESCRLNAVTVADYFLDLFRQPRSALSVDALYRLLPNKYAAKC